ncbi:MAG TPA: ABC transporter transmembrane domain-containing protein, partial [Actinomycetospora sp.]|nr:ABC transporter transmembrane domain-containing protein [Actinomycetospora sp.]
MRASAHARHRRDGPGGRGCVARARGRRGRAARDDQLVRPGDTTGRTRARGGSPRGGRAGSGAQRHWTTRPGGRHLRVVDRPRATSRRGGLSGCRPNLGRETAPDRPAAHRHHPEDTTERTTERTLGHTREHGADRARGWVRRLARDCWRHRALTAAALTASVLGVSLEAVGPLLIGTAVDRAVAGSTTGLGVLVTAMVVIAVVRFGAAFLRRYLGGRLSLGVQHDLRRRVFGSVSRLDGPKQDALRTGQVVSRANSDLQQVQGLLGMVPLVAGTLGQLVVSIAIMLWLSPLLTLVALVVLPAGIVFTGRMRRKLFPATWA